MHPRCKRNHEKGKPSRYRVVQSHVFLLLAPTQEDEMHGDYLNRESDRDLLDVNSDTESIDLVPDYAAVDGPMPRHITVCTSSTHLPLSLFPRSARTSPCHPGHSFFLLVFDYRTRTHTNAKQQEELVQQQ